MTAVGETAQPARPIRMLLTKHNIPILNGDYILPKIQDNNIRKSLADLSPEPPSSKQSFILSDIRRTSNSGIKFVQLVLEQPKLEKTVQVKTEKMEREEVAGGAGGGQENSCTICGETSPDKVAFNAHIKAHLKEKLNSKMKRNKEIKAEPGLAQRKELVKSLPVKRKMESLSSPEQQPARMKIKLESLDLPEMDTPSPEIPNLDDSFLSLASKSDLNNDLSLILDQIERDFESPHANLDTPPESDSDSDIFSFLQSEEETTKSPSPMLMVPPRLAESSLMCDEIENLLKPTDHDYLQPPPLSGAEGNNGGSKAAASPEPVPIKTYALVNHKTGKVVIQQEGVTPKIVSMFKLEDHKVQSNQIKMEAGREIIETTKGSHGEKEYKIVLGGAGAGADNKKQNIAKSKQTADCSICGKSITTKNMARHMEKHTGKKKFQCDICQASFFQKTHLKNHLVLHENGETYECSECQQKFLRRTDLQKHQKTVHCLAGSDCLNCPSCGLEVGDQHQLDLHSSSGCGGQPWEAERKELCGLCGEKFPDKEAMILHMVSHTERQQHACSVCGKTFAQKGHLNRHIKNHSQGELDLVCVVCSKLCKSRSSLAQHRSSHPACGECGAVLRNQEELESHLLQHHSQTVSSVLADRSDFMSLLSPGSLHSHDFEFFEDESNGSTVVSSNTNLSAGYSSDSTSGLDSIDNFSSFLTDLDSDSPLINNNISGDKSFSTSSDDFRANLTLDDISDSSFFDISSQLDDNIYDADLFSTMK